MNDNTPGELEPGEATLTFREQADGRKVSRLPGGKVVLIMLSELDRVGDGEQWHVRLLHRDTFAIAQPIARIRQDFSNPLLAQALSSALPKVASTAPARVAAGPVEPAEAGAPAPRGPASSPPEFVPRPDPEPPSLPLQPSLTGPGTPASASSPADLLPQPVPEAPSLPLVPPLPGPAPRPSVAMVPIYDPQRMIRPTDRVAFFVDGANMDLAARMAGYFVDYRKVRDYLIGGGTFYAAYYYVADFTASDGMQQRFFDFLSHVGYIIRKKPVKVIYDEDTGEKVIKGNLDTEIVLDMLNTVGNYDVAFLLSGDSDFERAVELLRSRGKRVYVVSSRRTCSREIGYVADKPIFLLENLRDRLARDDRHMLREPPPAAARDHALERNGA